MRINLVRKGMLLGAMTSLLVTLDLSEEMLERSRTLGYVEEVR